MIQLEGDEEDDHSYYLISPQFTKYFETEFEKDKFRRRLRYSKKLLVKEESM